MQFMTKLSVAILALAVGGEANHQALHARQFFRDHRDHHKDVSQTPSVSSVFVYPTPLHSSVAASSSSVAVSSSVATASSSIVTPAPVPLSTGVPGSSYAASDVETQTASEVNEITLTYTLGTGTSKTVVTTTIHRTSTDIHTVYVTPESSPLSTPSPSSTISLVNVPSAGADNAQACSQATVTVTDTATVTVTATPTPTSPVQEVGGNSNNGDEDQDHKKPHKPEGDHGKDNDKDHDKDHDKDGKRPQFTPPPYGNGTAPFPSGVAKPTGFVTSRLPFPTGSRRH